MLTPLDKILIEEMENEDCMLIGATRDEVLEAVIEDDPHAEINALFPER